MANWLVVGDIHGEWARFNKLIKMVLDSDYAIDEVIQVGDFGFLPNFQRYASFTKDAAIKMPIRFIDGNHDHTDILTSNGWWDYYQYYDAEYIPRGTVEDSTLFMGGAISIDREARIAGSTWFTTEVASAAEGYRASDNIRKARYETNHMPHIMIAHDTTHEAGRRMFALPNDPQRILLDGLWDIFRPRIYIHGHHHRYVMQDINGTLFISLNTVSNFDDITAETVRECSVMVDTDNQLQRGIYVPYIKGEV